jgi:tetratricopeptide (TPR) repeat protein
MAESDQEKRERGRIKLTPEQRRFLGGATVRQAETEEESPKAEPEAKVRTSASEPPAKSKSLPPESAAEVESSSPEPAPQSEPQTPRSKQHAPRRRKKWRVSRVLEVQNLALLIGGVVLLGATFYVGKKFEYWRYVLASHREAKIAARVTGDFAGATAEELVEHAVMSEQLGQWDDAARRLIAAKYKNMSLGGILFHAGKLYYDHSDFESADRLFESAIGFGENVDAANYLRGMIAVSRNDFPAAERFFEAATNAAPFNADYYYSLAETLRKDHRPKDAILRYEQAARRGTDESAQTICRFKARMAALEAGDVDPVNAELEQKRKAGNLSVDWLMTEAALAIHHGDTSDAVGLINQARAADEPRLFGAFAACVGDRFFTVAGDSSHELAQACRINQAKNPGERR